MEMLTEMQREWEGIRILTDVLIPSLLMSSGYMLMFYLQPNFLHAGDHVHLGPGVSSTRRTNPAVDLHDLPRIDLVLLSHYHGYLPSASIDFTSLTSKVTILTKKSNHHFAAISPSSPLLMPKRN